MSDSPKVYVGTYAKYNSGSIEGAWLDLDDYSSRDEFIEACHELHDSDDEGADNDHEFMFQDWEGIPDGMIAESSIEPELWDWLNLDDDDKTMLAAYREGIDSDGSLETARDAYAGTYDNEIDWAYEYIDDSGMLDSMPESLRNYFDYAAFLRDCSMGGDINFVYYDGTHYAFNNC